jgi:demethylmenaquinone methyltransferase/2-methoxy-6-polyprenyl-1,4-benzoquinol methylase
MLDHFGFLAPFYERFIKPSFPETLASLLDPAEGSMLLDVGGGTGRVAQFFSSDMGNVFLIDLSHKMLVESLGKDRLLPACSHSEYLPYPDETFDRIIMVDALHHVCDQAQTISELWRVLKPSGRLVIEEPDIHHPVVKLVALAEKLALMRSHFLNQGQISDLFNGLPAQISHHQEGHIIWVIVEKFSSKEE